MEIATNLMLERIKLCAKNYRYIEYFAFQLLQQHVASCQHACNMYGSTYITTFYDLTYFTRGPGMTFITRQKRP